MVGILNDPLSLIFAASGINVRVKHNLLYVQLSEPPFAELCGFCAASVPDSDVHCPDALDGVGMTQYLERF